MLLNLGKNGKIAQNELHPRVNLGKNGKIAQNEFLCHCG